MVNQAEVYRVSNDKYVVYYMNKLVIQTSYKKIALETATALNNGERYVIPTGYQNY